MNPDIANAAIELFGAGFTWRNAYQLYKERSLSGVYWPSTLFFTLWGAWNIFYYTALNQPFSFYAGILLTSGNAAWVILAIKLRVKEGAMSVLNLRLRAFLSR